jgi:hypothetical protein
LPGKTSAHQDDNLQPFCWTYGTGELIDELARIDEIPNLSEVLQQSTDMPDHCDEILSLPEVLQQPTDMTDHFGIDLF